MDHEGRTEEEAARERWEQMYQHMGPSTPTRYETDDGSDDEDGDEDTETTGGDAGDEDEPECVECGHGPGAYEDEALDQFTLNYDEETVHYGCK